MASAFGNDTIYLYWKSINYQWPIVVNETLCFYASHLYAFDKMSGELLWQKSLDTIVTTMLADNYTFYYGTRDSNIFGVITRDRPEPPLSSPSFVTTRASSPAPSPAYRLDGRRLSSLSRYSPSAAHEVQEPAY